MILAYWCVLIAAFMPIGFVGYAKFTGQRRMGPRDNHQPRAWLALAVVAGVPPGRVVETLNRRGYGV